MCICICNTIIHHMPYVPMIPSLLLLYLLSFPLFNDMQSHPPYYNPSGFILNSFSFIKFSFYVFILNPIFWI